MHLKKAIVRLQGPQITDCMAHGIGGFCHRPSATVTTTTNDNFILVHKTCQVGHCLQQSCIDALSWNNNNTHEHERQNNTLGGLCIDSGPDSIRHGCRPKNKYSQLICYTSSEEQSYRRQTKESLPVLLV